MSVSGPQEPHEISPLPDQPPEPRDQSLFIALPRPDGTYTLALTEPGIASFETALGIANDLGRNRRISDRSTLADLMERTALREELSLALRNGGQGVWDRAYRFALRGRLWGTEDPGAAGRALARLLRLLIIVILAVWTLDQFLIALHDVEAVPGILAGIPNSILNLNPGAPFADVQHRISDATNHVVTGIIGMIVTWIAAMALSPLRAVYRNDQIVPGTRRAGVVMQMLARWFARKRQSAT